MAGLPEIRDNPKIPDRDKNRRRFNERSSLFPSLSLAHFIKIPPGSFSSPIPSAVLTHSFQIELDHINLVPIYFFHIQRKGRIINDIEDFSANLTIEVSMRGDTGIKSFLVGVNIQFPDFPCFD